jgi:uncharacterized protein YnzC (UPF0291/DUF896 family)
MELDPDNQSESKKILKHVRAVLKTLKRPELIAMRAKIKHYEELAKDETHPQHSSRKATLTQFRNTYRQSLCTKYSQLQYCYPSIFNMLVDNDPDKFEINRLIQMLKMRDQAKAHRNPEKVKSELEKASVKIGQQYFNQFVKPTLDSMDKEK